MGPRAFPDPIQGVENADMTETLEAIAARQALVTHPRFRTLGVYRGPIAELARELSARGAGLEPAGHGVYREVLRLEQGTRLGTGTLLWECAPDYLLIGEAAELDALLEALAKPPRPADERPVKLRRE
jgi:hypothetical protein